jgi:hypothetical protein
MHIRSQLVTAAALTAILSSQSWAQDAGPATARILLHVTDERGQATTLEVAHDSYGTIARNGSPTLRIRPLRASSTGTRLEFCLGRSLEETSCTNPTVVSNELVPGDSINVALGAYQLQVRLDEAAWLTASGIDSAGSPGPGECCVTCGETTYCGRVVVAPCGNCSATTCGGAGAPEGSSPARTHSGDRIPPSIGAVVE